MGHTYAILPYWPRFILVSEPDLNSAATYRRHAVMFVNRSSFKGRDAGSALRKPEMENIFNLDQLLEG
eukprot:432660-Pleurochrysis_carterae.AAC.3